MKPLGTITMYYRFLESEIVSELDSIMNDAENYYDFLLRLSERACIEESPTNLAYLAAIHAWRLSATKAKEMLLEKFNSDLIISSWASQYNKIGFASTITYIDQAIDFTDQHWLQIELLCLKSWCSRYQTADETYWFEPLERALEMLKKHPNLECFAALVHTTRSELGFQDVSYESAYDSHNIGLEFAKKFNDEFQIYQLLWTRSSWIKAWDTKKAITLQEEAYELAKKFGSPQKIAEAMTDMGRISEAMGEYDLALECYHCSLETYGTPEMEMYREIMDCPSFGISRVYCELGDGQSCLNWIDTLIDMLASKADDHPYIYGQRVEALVLLKRFDEAAKQLEVCQKLSLKSADEGFMSLCELPASYFEMAQGDPLTAISILEPIANFMLSGPAAIYSNRCLIALARAEIAANLQSSTKNVSEQWMMKLERHAHERAFPGIIMLHALLKAEYLLALKNQDDALDILNEALRNDFSDTSRTIYKRIQTKINELR